MKLSIILFSALFGTLKATAVDPGAGGVREVSAPEAATSDAGVGSSLATKFLTAKFMAVTHNLRGDNKVKKKGGKKPSPPPTEAPTPNEPRIITDKPTPPPKTDASYARLGEGYCQPENDEGYYDYILSGPMKVDSDILTAPGCWAFCVGLPDVGAELMAFTFDLASGMNAENYCTCYYDNGGTSPPIADLPSGSKAYFCWHGSGPAQLLSAPNVECYKVL